MRPTFSVFMKLRLALAVVLASASVLNAGEETLRYSVQIVRGTEEKNAPRENAKLVSSKLAERLNRFRWKYYWEVRRHDVTVSRNKPSTVRLSKERSLALERTADGHVEMRLYREGKLARTARQKPHSNSCEIMGGTSEEDSPWFVVIQQKAKDPAKQ